MAMVVLIALRIPAFGFCLCEQDLTLNNGICCQQGACLEKDNPDCCSSEPAGDSSVCRDCVIPLSLDLGDFNWSGAQFNVQNVRDIPATLSRGIRSFLQPGNPTLSLKGSIRGSPPVIALSVLRRTGILKL